MFPTQTLARLLSSNDIIINNYRLMKLYLIGRVRISVKRSAKILVLPGIIKRAIFSKCFYTCLALKLSDVHVVPLKYKIFSLYSN